MTKKKACLKTIENYSRRMNSSIITCKCASIEVALALACPLKITALLFTLFPLIDFC